MTDLKAISDRIQKLEDLEAIRHVTASYSDCVNKGWSGKEAEPERLGAVFTEDIRWKCEAMKVDTQGLAAVVAMLKGSVAGLQLAMHSFTNPLIDVRGDAATGQWLLWVATKANDASNEVFQSETVQYSRTRDGWRIRSIDLHFGTMLK